MKSRYLFLLVTILLAGCSVFSEAVTPTATLAPIPTDVTPNPLPEPTDPTQLITVRAGETFELVLPSNSSTGYRWQLAEDPDANLIEFVSQDYIAEQPVIPGSGGVEVWTFRAASPGDATIMLGYYPPSNNTEPDETVIFSIEVE